MHNFKKIFLLINATFCSLLVMAQDLALPKEAGFMRSEGKIYVVMAIVITILAGLIFYVARLDNKITNLEKGKH